MARFGDGTGTGTIRKHLADNHLADWVRTCDRLKIPITARLVLPKVEACRLGFAEEDKAADGATSGPQSVRKFSPDAFVEAIVEWIVFDDQVSPDFVVVADEKHYLGHITYDLLYRHCVSLTILTSVLSF